MATLPTFPTFSTNDTSMTKLQQLSDAVKFLAVADGLQTNTRPLWHFYKTATQSISASTVTVLQYGTVGHDTDSTWTTPGFATIKTQGFYACEAIYPVSQTATNKAIHTFFTITAGSGNPNHTAGTTTNFGVAGWSTGTDSTRDVMVTLRGVSPWVLYPNDTVKVNTWSDNTLTIDFTSATCYAQFTGYWHQYGTTP